MNKQIIHTDAAPAAVGPYSQAVRTGQMLYTAGQVAIIPGTGKLVEGDVTPQTEQALRNLTAVLAAAGTDLSHIVKTTVFLQDMADFAAMNAVYATFFGPNPPARSTVAVAGLPLGARVEIEAVAIIPG
jgi:2-iminobutanoate/2-iminopropanoate deaminase